MKQSKTMMVVFLAPALFFYAVIFMYPTIRTTFMSFFEVGTVTDPVSTWSFVGFQNFFDLWDSSLFVQSMKNLVNIWLWGGLLVFSLAIIFSVILTSGVKGKSFYRAVIYLPNVVSAVAMGTMWLHYVYNSKYGLLQSIFSFFAKEQFALLTEWLNYIYNPVYELFSSIFSVVSMEHLASVQWTGPDMIFISLLIAYSFGMIGYYLLIFVAAIDGIPEDLYEAATIAGASGRQKFFRVTMPLLKDVFRTNIVLWTISTVAFFVWSQIFSPLTPELGTVTPMVYMYQMVFGSNTVVTERNVGMGAAVGVILTLIVIFMFIITSVIFRKDPEEA